MKPTLSILFICFILSSCTHIIKLTNNEDKGVKDVLNFYGGRCEYSVGINASTKDGTAKFFELELQHSDVAEKYFTTEPEFQTRGMAYMFYKDLNAEKKNYDEIHSILILKNGHKYQSSLSRDTLELISEKMKVFDKVVDLIKTKNFDGLKPLLSSDSYTDSAETNLVTSLKKTDPQFGTVKGFYLYGFRFETYNGYNVLNILGALIRDKQDSQLSLKIDLKESEDKIHFLDYTWFPKN